MKQVIATLARIAGKSVRSSNAQSTLVAPRTLTREELRAAAGGYVASPKGSW